MSRLLLVAAQLLVLGCSPKGSYYLSESTQAEIHGGETIGSNHDISNSMIYISVVFINKETNEQESNDCTGIILDRRHILTAAHCLYTEYASLTTPYVSFSTDVVNSPAEVIRAERFKIHPEYEKSSKYDRIGLDIAVIKLTKDLPLTVKPVLLDKGTISIEKNRNLWVSGYGRSELEGDYDGKLRAASLRGRVRVSDGQIWIDSESSCPLEGDSGGALYVQELGTSPVVVGISSTLAGDIKGNCYSYNIFTAISPHVDFIKNTIDDFKR